MDTTLVGLMGSAFLIGLSGAMMPGPVLVGTISWVARRGFWAGPQVVCGHALIEFPLVLLLAAGAAQGIRQPHALGAIGLMGGLALLLMAVLMIKDAPRLSLQLGSRPDGTDRRRLSHPIWSGLLLSAANPYWILWWATAGLAQITIAVVWGFFGLVLFFIGHILSDLLWYGLVSGMVAGGKSFLSDRLYRAFIVVCAAMLLYFSLVFGREGWRMARTGEFTSTAQELMQLGER